MPLQKEHSVNSNDTTLFFQFKVHVPLRTSCVSRAFFIFPCNHSTSSFMMSDVGKGFSHISKYLFNKVNKHNAGNSVPSK